MAKVATATTPKEILEVWQQFCYFEFVKKDATAALGTMCDNPHVLMMLLAIGGKGRKGVDDFYHDYFLAQLPADMTRLRKPTHVAAMGGRNPSEEMSGAAVSILAQTECEPHAKRDNSAQFHSRFARFRSLLHFTACRILGGPEEAEVAVRNCWRKASRNPRALIHDGEFRSWLLRLLIDEAFAIRRLRQWPRLGHQRSHAGPRKDSMRGKHEEGHNGTVRRT